MNPLNASTDGVIKTDPKLKQDDLCPQCKSGYMERRQHRFSTERGPNLPDCDWLECCECDFKTDPE